VSEEEPFTRSNSLQTYIILRCYDVVKLVDMTSITSYTDDNITLCAIAIDYLVPICFYIQNNAYTNYIYYLNLLFHFV